MTSQVQRPRGAIGEVSDHEPLQLGARWSKELKRIDIVARA